MRSRSAPGLLDRLMEWVAAAFGRGPKPVPVPVRVRANEPARRDRYR